MAGAGCMGEGLVQAVAYAKQKIEWGVLNGLLDVAVWTQRKSKAQRFLRKVWRGIAAIYFSM